MSFNWIMSLKGYNLVKAKKKLLELRDYNPLELKDWQEKRKWEQAKFFYENNRFYRQKVGAGLPDKWDDLPILYKSDYQDDFDSLLSHGFTKKDVYVSSTSGSSGHPFYFAKDRIAHAINWAYINLRYQDLGIPTNGKQARFYGIPMEIVPYTIEKMKDFFINRVRFPVFDLSEETLLKYTKKFKKIKFDYIYGYAGSIHQYSKFLLEKNIRLKDYCPTLKVVIVTAEVCTQDMRADIEKAIGVKVKNEYGSSELGYSAYDQGEGKWIIASEKLLMESIPIPGVDFEKIGGRLLFTDLHNKAFPFIRYDIGDIGVLERDIEGRHLLKKLSGRTNDIAILPSGKKAAGLTFYYVSRSILEKDFVTEFIVRQVEVDHFVIDMVSKRPLTEQDKEEIKDKMIKYLESGLRLSFNLVDKIERPSNGKIKHFYSELKDNLKKNEA